MVWEEAAPIRSRKNNNNMDSNFFQMAASKSADEEQGSPTRRRTAFTALDTESPLQSDENTHHPLPGSGGGKRQQTSLREQLHSFRIMSAPYFRESKEGKCLFAIMVVLSLANSAVKVAFSYLSRDFWSALSNKEEEQL